MYSKAENARTTGTASGVAAAPALPAYTIGELLIIHNLELSTDYGGSGALLAVGIGSAPDGNGREYIIPPGGTLTLDIFAGILPVYLMGINGTAKYSMRRFAR